MTARPLCVELFCGTFGWSAGWLARGGHAVGFDIEHHPWHGDVPPGAELVLQDVLTLHGSQFRNADLILASPPCQKFSYMAMPWTRAKEQAKWYRDPAHPERLADLTALFDACFRLQREASEAAGRWIPLVVENVVGAQKWVGRAAWHFGSYYLWGDVPALMPSTMRSGVKVGGLDCSNRDRKGQAFNTHAEREWKNSGGSWFNVGSPGQTVVNRNPVHEAAKTVGHLNKRDGHGHTRHLTNQAEHDAAHMSDGVNPFTPSGEPLGKNRLGRKHGSKSNARRAASAHIARIPHRLSDWIAEVYWPNDYSTEASA